METSPFLYEDEILVRRWTPPHQTTEVRQTVLPRQYRETVLRMAHITPWVGHFGRKKTSLRVLRHFFWPGVRRDIADMSRRCQTCQKTHRRCRGGKGEVWEIQDPLRLRSATGCPQRSEDQPLPPGTPHNP